MSTHHDYAAAVLIITPQGIPLVRDPKKPRPHYWKLPGGRSIGSETALQCAVREVEEELGIILKPAELELLSEEFKGNHHLVIFKTTLSELPVMRAQGDEQEEIAVFTPKQILEMKDFSPNHLRVIEGTLIGLGK